MTVRSYNLDQHMLSKLTTYGARLSLGNDSDHSEIKIENPDSRHTKTERRQYTSSLSVTPNSSLILYGYVDHYHWQALLSIEGHNCPNNFFDFPCLC